MVPIINLFMKTTLQNSIRPAFSFLVMLIFMILDLQAQDYLVSFAGTGASTTVDSVKVENLTQGTKLLMKGSDVLHLVPGTTGIESESDNLKNGISFSPNPMADYCRMLFALPGPGRTEIILYDLTGRKIIEKQDFLLEGQHTYRIQGLYKGLYIVSVNSGKYSLTGKLTCLYSGNIDAKIVYESTMAVQEKEGFSKGLNETKDMPYKNGDRLMMTGISGNYGTIITDIITESKTITYNFVGCTDGNGNNYLTVKIGQQTWMAENLRTVLYNDGTGIPVGVIYSSPGYCYYNYPNLPPCAVSGFFFSGCKYGALYNWYAVNTAKLCPKNWHVSSDFDWIDLADYLGGENVLGGKLKETGFYHWSSPNYGATNVAGFTALPGGRFKEGSFRNLGTIGCWWTSTEIPGGSYANYRAIYYDMGTVVKIYYELRDNYFSVRCVKD
jgi:uncharacterized protein (TIGR02145 family)